MWDVRCINLEMFFPLSTAYRSSLCTSARPPRQNLSHVEQNAIHWSCVQPCLYTRYFPFCSQSLILVNRLAVCWLFHRPCQVTVLEEELSQVEFLPCLVNTIMVFGLPSASHYGRFSWCGEFWVGLFSQCSWDRVSDDNGSDTVVSPSRYNILRNAVKTSKGAFTLVNPRGDSLARLPWCIFLRKISLRRWPGVVSHS